MSPSTHRPQNQDSISRLLGDVKEKILKSTPKPRNQDLISMLPGDVKANILKNTHKSRNQDLITILPGDVKAKILKTTPKPRNQDLISKLLRDVKVKIRKTTCRPRNQDLIRRLSGDVKGKIDKTTRRPQNQDFISRLPDDIKVKILEHLSIDEAVRSSILSKSWRYTWSNITKLDIKDSYFPSEDSLIGFMDMFSPLPNGSISELILDFDIFSPSRKTVGRWISILSRRNIQSIKIMSKYSFGKYQIPSDIYSCHSLEIVYLYCCLVDAPFTFRNRWKTLSLISVRIDSASFERLISNSPSLEKLEIDKPFDIIGLKIHAPNLKDLLISGVFTELYLDVPSLVHASFKIYKGNISNLNSALSAVSNIEKLDIAYYNVDNLWEKLSISFNNLNEIAISFDVSNHHYVSFALFLFENAPNFRTLLLKMISTWYEDPDVIFLLESKLKDGSVFTKLTTMHVHGPSASDKMIMAFLKFVLLTAPLLKKISLSKSYWKYEGNIHELMKLHGLSNKIEILLLQENY